MAETDIERLAIQKEAKEKRERKGKSRLRLRILIITICVIVAISVLWGAFSKGAAVRTAVVEQVYPSQLLSKISASGYVVAQRKADVATKITGQLVSLMVREGSMVKAGQVIARIEDEDARALVDQSSANVKLAQAREQEAKANLDNASVNFERMKKLVKTGAVSRSEYDASEARYLASQATFEALSASVKSSRAALESSRVALSYTEIKAPFDAVVLTKNADVGDIITPLGSAANAKAAVVSIADLSSLEVEADVSESNIGAINVGQPCDITLDALPDIHFQGFVDTIVPTVDRSKATVLVKVRFKERDQRILPEMSTKIGFLKRPLSPRENRPRPMVNNKAVVDKSEKAAVFLVKGNRAQKAAIRTGEAFGDMVEVTQGVKPGDVVILDPPGNLKDGAKITVLEK